MIHHAYPNQISDQGNNLTQDRFYHGLSPSLHDALGFTMAELPEREQVNTSFDTLYTLAKKMEAHHPSLSHSSRPDPLMLTEISIGDSPSPQDRLLPLKMKSCSPT